MSLYCKKCGRQLRAEARFCDRCGYVIPKETAKRTTGSASARKTSTSTAKNDRRRETSKKKTNSGVKVIVFLLFAVLIGAVSGMISYNMMSEETKKTNKEHIIENQIEETEEPIEEMEETPEPEKEKETAKPSEKPKESKENTKKIAKFSIADKCSTYDNDRMNGIKCPYPDSFVQSSKSNKDTLISYEDSLNDGYMKICVEEIGKSDTASKLMREYTEGLGTKTEHEDSGDGWYEVSFSRNNKYNHRKAVIADGALIYYDFSYDIDSEEQSAYEDYIEYFDYYLDEELSDIQSSEN